MSTISRPRTRSMTPPTASSSVNQIVAPQYNHRRPDIADSALVGRRLQTLARRGIRVAVIRRESSRRQAGHAIAELGFARHLFDAAAAAHRVAPREHESEEEERADHHEKEHDAERHRRTIARSIEHAGARRLDFLHP